VAVDVVASLFVAVVAMGAQPFVAVKVIGRAVAVAVLVQQFVPTEAVSVGVAVLAQ
jgi:hypothetical protein